MATNWIISDEVKQDLLDGKQELCKDEIIYFNKIIFSEKEGISLCLGNITLATLSLPATLSLNRGDQVFLTGIQASMKLPLF